MAAFVLHGWPEQYGLRNGLRTLHPTQGIVAHARQAVDGKAQKPNYDADQIRLFWRLAIACSQPLINTSRRAGYLLSSTFSPWTRSVLKCL